MPFAYFDKLTPRQKRIYLESDRMGPIELSQPELLRNRAEAIEQALRKGDRVGTGKLAQSLMDALTTMIGVGRIRVVVLERRPSWATGELHGLYETDEQGRHTVSVWMRTAQRVQVVKFKTFLRTLLHELCHHLDYHHFGLAESYHTEGFYKRESSLLRQILVPTNDSNAPIRRA